LRRAWPIILCVYLFNAFFVDMAYQFVIGLVFTVARHAMRVRGVCCLTTVAYIANQFPSSMSPMLMDEVEELRRATCA